MVIMLHFVTCLQHAVPTYMYTHTHLAAHYDDGQAEVAGEGGLSKRQGHTVQVVY